MDSELIITSDFQAQVNFLHGKVGAKEWQSKLIYKEEFEKDNEVITKAIFTPLYMIPIDIGESASTETDFKGGYGNYWSKYYDDDMEIPHKIGKIHTHHNMGVSFSSTDQNDLEKQAEVYKYYLSVVTDFKGDYKGKLGFKVTGTDPFGKEISTVKTLDCKVRRLHSSEYMQTVIDAYEEALKESKEKSKNSNKGYYNPKIFNNSKVSNKSNINCTREINFASFFVSSIDNNMTTPIEALRNSIPKLYQDRTLDLDVILSILEMKKGGEFYANLFEVLQEIYEIGIKSYDLIPLSNIKITGHKDINDYTNKILETIYSYEK